MSAPKEFELAQIAAMLSAKHPELTGVELATKAIDLWGACELVLASRKAKAANEAETANESYRLELERMRNATNVPYNEFLKDLIPHNNETDRAAIYRHFLEEKGEPDVGKIIEQQKAHGVDSVLANFIRHDFARWRKSDISRKRKAARAQRKNS